MSEKPKFFSFIPDNVNINFARQRFFWLAISILLIAGSLIEYRINGLTKGIEFSGGADIQVRFDEAVSTGDVRTALDEGKMDGASVQTIEAPTDLDIATGITAGTAAGSTSPDFLIKVKSIEGEEIADTVKRVRAALEAKFGPSRTSDQAEGKWEIRRQESASASAVAEMTEKGLEAFLLSTIAIFFYIVFRFSQVDFTTAVGYATGAVIATAHDVLVVFAAFVVLHKEVTLTVVAAVMTVIGYSLNDTIVVFDRIRENHGRYRARDMWETVNRSVNESLSRTIITSGTTLLVLVALFFFGGTVIHDFAFTLIVGIVTGTYSSIFVASPAFVWTTQGLRKLRKTDAKSATRTPPV